MTVAAPALSATPPASPMPMRVLHVISSLDPAAGGPPKVAVSLAAAQARLGHEATILTGDLGGDPADHPLLAPLPGGDAVRTVVAGPVSAKALIWSSAAPPIVGQTAANADVVHLHGVWEPLLAASADAARDRGIPYLLLAHGMLDPWSLSQSKWKKRLALALRHRRLLNQAAALHLLNSDERDLIERLHLTAGHVIIPNGVFLDEIEPLPEPGAFRTARPELADRRFVLFLSRLHFKKGLDVLADAFAPVAEAFDDVDLVVAGPDEGYRQPFVDRVAALGLTDRVHLPGPIYGRDKYAALVDAACFCLPSRQEGFSVAITEALACGCVPVITQGCHFPEVASADAGSVTPFDAAAVGEALIATVGEEDRRTRQAGNAKRLVRDRYTWPAIAQQTIEAYASVGATTGESAG